MWVYWRHLANTIITIQLVLPSAHPSPQPKRQVDRFSRFCTAHGVKSLYSTMVDPFPKMALLLGDLDPHIIYDSLSECEPTIQTASQLVQQVTAECPCTLQWAAPSPLKIALPMWESRPQSNTGFLCPPESSTKTVQPFCRAYQCDVPTERQTDRQTTLLGR